MRKSTLLISVALATALAAASAFAEPTGAEVMARYFHRAKPKTETTTMVMTITKNGSSLTRTLTNWGQGDNARGETERKTVKFLAPGDIKGSGFLSVRKPDGSTESQLWLPALGKVRRLSSGASDQDSAFFGSDFTNRDISGFVESDFTYELTGTQGNTFTIEAKPVKPMGYEKLVYTIEAEHSTAVRVEYYKAGKLFKAQDIISVAVGAYQVPSAITMTAASGSKTELTVKDQKVDLDLGDIFTERFLKQ